MERKRNKNFLTSEIYCPLSGIKLGGNIIGVHKVRVSVCSNETLTAICPLHRLRIFITDQVTIELIMKENLGIGMKETANAQDQNRS